MQTSGTRGGRSAVLVRFAFVAATSLLTVLSSTRPASAFERQWHLGGGIGAAGFASGPAKIGPALGLHAAYGLSDMFDLRAELTGSRHVRDDGLGNLELYSAAIGIAYKIDILEWVPYVGLFVGSYVWGGPGAYANTTAFIGVSSAVGLDYATSRSFALGIQARYHGGLNDLPNSLTDGSYYTALFRAEYRWGW
jgi:Outer membrane protein beta-barrel domain